MLTDSEQPYTYDLIHGWMAKFQVKFKGRVAFYHYGVEETKLVVKALNEAFTLGRYESAV